MKDAEVRKSNALIEASYRLSLAEHRTVLACIAQVGRDEEISDDVVYTVSALDIAEHAGISRQDAYRDLKAAADRLYERSITVPYAPDGEEPKLRKFRWIQEQAIYQAGEGRVGIRFSTPILPYLRELSERFTFYPLSDVAKMTSAYAIRLYELLMQWKKAGKREVEVEWLRTVFQLEGQYPLFADFRKRVIEPAVKQINEHSPLRVKVSQRKTGRKVTHLAFTFAPKKPAKIGSARKAKPAQGKRSVSDNDLVAGIPRHVIEQHAQPGEEIIEVIKRLYAERREGRLSW